MLRTAIFLLLITVTAVASADGSARQWLEKMATAERYLNYSGTFIYIRGSKVETMQIVHGFDEQGERERLTSLTGESRELVRDAQHVYQVLPQKQAVLIEPRSRQLDPDAFLSSLAEENAWYDFSLGERERIADHACQVISITARDDLRNSYSLCTEQESGLLLKAEILSPRGIALEQMIFTNLSMPQQISSEQLRTTSHQPGYRLLRSAELAPNRNPAELVVDQRWLLRDALPGFELISNSMRRIATSESPVQHLVLSDGLASVSIFIAEFTPGQPYAEGVIRSGALQAVSRLNNGFIITVIGEIPENSAKLLSSAVYQDKTP